MNNGWIKLHRKTLDNPVVMKDPDHLAVWIYLLLEATHVGFPTMFGGEKIMLSPGQLVTGRKKIAEKTGVNEYKTMRVLKLFESEQQIAQLKKRYGTLITILSWDEYQDVAQQDAQQLHNDCTTTAQQLHTKQECKNVKNAKNVKKEIYSQSIEEIVAYFNEVTGKHYKASTPRTRTLIKARLNEHFTVDDFKTVIYKKAKEWKGDPKMEQFIRPETLFGTKFEGYLNQSTAPENEVEGFYEMMEEWANDE